MDWKWRGLLGLVLALFFAWGAIQAVRAQPSFPSSAFTSPDVCAECHTEIYALWSKSTLAQAWTDPFYRAVMHTAVEETEGELATYCIICHTPIGVMAGEHIPVDGSNLSPIATRGVQCDFCHTVSGVAGISNGHFISTPGNVKRGPFDDAVSPFHDTAYSVLHTRAEICGICHDIYNPRTGLQIEATYFELREGPYGKQGIVCQDCHMTPGAGITKPNPGRAAIQGPEREHIWTHGFTGGNVLYGNAELAVERLQAAAQLAIQLPQRLTTGETVNMDVVVRNIGAGHYMPTSLTYIREMWLEVVVQDRDGNELLRDRVLYNTVYEDAAGVHDGSVNSWRAVRVYRDHRVPPGGQLTENFRFDLPRGARGPLTVSTTLNYRSASPEVTAKYGVPEFPPVEMTRQEAMVELVAPSPLANVSLPGWLQGSLWAIAMLLLLGAALWVVFKS